MSEQSSGNRLESCPACGARGKYVLAVGPVSVLTGVEYAKLRAVFLGELDAYWCSVCKQPRGFRSTVAVDLADGGERVACLGEMTLGASEAARRELLDGLAKDVVSLSMELQPEPAAETVEEAVA